MPPLPPVPLPKVPIHGFLSCVIRTCQRCSFDLKGEKEVCMRPNCESRCNFTERSCTQGLGGDTGRQCRPLASAMLRHSSLIAPAPRLQRLVSVHTHCGCRGSPKDVCVRFCCLRDSTKSTTNPLRSKLTSNRTPRKARRLLC